MTAPATILVTGDTHLPRKRGSLPVELTREMDGADYTIHTGDFCTAACKALFDAHGPVLAVSGNNDDPVLADSMPESLDITTGASRIVVTHGHREPGSSARDSVQRAYVGQTDLVIFGHSHQPCWEEVEGTWFLNPGSPTMKRREPQFSFAMLDLNPSGAFTVHFRYFDRPSTRNK